MADVLAKTKVNTLAKKKKEGNTWEHTFRSKGKALVDMMANTLAEQWTHTTGDTPLEVEAKEVVLTLGGSLEEAEAGTLGDKLSDLEARHFSMPWLQSKQRRRLKHLLSHSVTRCGHEENVHTRLYTLSQARVKRFMDTYSLFQAFR